MRVTIHRGSKEIGGSCVEIVGGHSRIIIDIGMPLVKPDGGKFDSRKYERKDWRELVQEKILPDIPGLYDGNTNSNPVDGVLISHAHSDHHGFLQHVRKDIPCFLGEGTRELLDLNDLFMRQRNDMQGRPHTLFESGQSFPIGEFKITPYLMDHSAFDAHAFLVECGGKRLIYSGDFREHGRKPGALRSFLKSVPKGVDALLLEGTQVGRESSGQANRTEKEVENEMVRTIKETAGPVLCVVSGQNIDRLVSLYKATRDAGRTFVIDLYTAAVLDGLKDLAKIPVPTSKFPNLAVYCPRDQRDKLEKSSRKDLLDRLNGVKSKWDRVVDNLSSCVVLIRQSRSKQLLELDQLQGATLIYSLWGGYLKDDSLAWIRELIEQKDMQLVPIHTSGHADLDTLKKVVNVVKPKAIIPIHSFGADRYSDIFPETMVMKAQDGVMIGL